MKTANNLGIDHLLAIFSQLSIKDLFSVMQVSRLWQEAAITSLRRRLPEDNCVDASPYLVEAQLTPKQIETFFSLPPEFQRVIAYQLTHYKKATETKRFFDSLHLSDMIKPANVFTIFGLADHALMQSYPHVGTVYGMQAFGLSATPFPKTHSALEASKWSGSGPHPRAYHLLTEQGLKAVAAGQITLEESDNMTYDQIRERINPPKAAPTPSITASPAP